MEMKIAVKPTDSHSLGYPIPLVALVRSPETLNPKLAQPTLYQAPTSRG